MLETVLPGVTVIVIVAIWVMVYRHRKETKSTDEYEMSHRGEGRHRLDVQLEASGDKESVGWRVKFIFGVPMAFPFSWCLSFCW